MVMLTDGEREHLARLCETCADLLSHRGCNDFLAPNTDENWALWERMHADNLHITVEEWQKHRDHTPRPKGKTI
jgi:hypothetical protein